MAKIDTSSGGVETDAPQPEVATAKYAPLAACERFCPKPVVPSAPAILTASGVDVGDVRAWPTLLDQDAASGFLLHVCGVRLAPKSLQKRRVVGGSPPFRKIGGRVAYPRDLLKAWGDAQAGPVVTSTSQLTAAA